MPLVGQILNQQYQLNTQLGQNASRQTWLAQDIATTPSTPVVVKLLALSPQMHWDECNLFEREAQVLQSLDHSRIPKYRDYFVLDSLPDSRFSWFGLVQSYIPGISLQNLLTQGRHFTSTEVEKVAVEVLRILDDLHNHIPQILHRDIKPSNLLWGNDDRIYLVDFGSVQNQAAVEGVTFSVVGTYGYVPMEQFAGRAVPASDLYALGATLIHLLTGVAPADLPDQEGRIVFADRVNTAQSMTYWISKLTAPNLSERFSSAQQALTAWKNRQTLSAPLTHPQPTGSQIQLKKSADQLEIRLPARGRYVDHTLYFEVFFNALRILHGPKGCLLGVLGPFAYPVGLIYALLAPLWFVFGRTDLVCDRRYIRIRWKLFGLWHQLPQKVCTSSILAVNEGVLIEQCNLVGVILKTKQGNKICTNPLSKVEREWLVQEMRDWLQLKCLPEPTLSDLVDDFNEWSAS